MNKMDEFIKEFYDKFGDIDPNSLTGQVKKEFLKAKKIVDGVEKQKGMMGSVLDFLGEFGVETVQIGSKEFKKEEPNQFDDLK